MLQKVDQSERPITQWETGTLKWFDRTRRYGFIYFDEGPEDQAFLPWTVVQESNISERKLIQGAKILFTWKPSQQPGGRPEVTRLRLVSDRHR